MPSPCPCALCADPAYPGASRHARLRGLFLLLKPDDRAWCAAELAFPDEVLLAQLAELPVTELRWRRAALRASSSVASLEALVGLAADEVSREALLRRVRAQGYERETLELELRFGPRTMVVRVPDQPHSLRVLAELLVERVYGEVPPLDLVYDLGANVGLFALDVHARRPEARLVCVEPAPSCLALLEHNLGANGVKAEVVAAAVGATSGEATLWQAPPEAHGTSFLGSAGPAGASPVAVKLLPLEQVLGGEAFGVKVDVEGAEHGFGDGLGALSRARWLAGELHYREGLGERVAFGFEEYVKRHFELEWSHPVLLEEPGLVIRSFRSAVRSGRRAGGS